MQGNTAAHVGCTINMQSAQPQAIRAQDIATKPMLTIVNEQEAPYWHGSSCFRCAVSGAEGPANRLLI
jgi:hypothetical protein